MALTLFSASPVLAQQGDTMPEAGQPTAGDQTPGGQSASGLLARQDGDAFGPVRFEAGKAPFALRNNNWVAIKGPNIRGEWPGQTGANRHGFARFDDPAYSISGFIELMRIYHDRHGAKSAVEILQRYSPSGDCSGAPSLPPNERRDGGGCVENQKNAPVTATRAARAVGLAPTDDLDLFGSNGEIKHPDRLRALIDAVVTQEVGASHCPQPPRGEGWIGCKVDDDIYARAVDLLDGNG
ncbi:hypothetical protein N825_13780 [Skermanella stibiiresistens SB22]|uniref:Uncharacterized protein n=2 Tax=Skermanella TaxID=204447 RepID=W9H3D3_9PROT|nr:hypothetical protein N825_13780 [Skermanella stibiiresistens SB22]